MKGSLFVAAVLVILAIPVLSPADPIRPGPYVAGFVGATVPLDTNITTLDYLGPGAFSDRLQFDPGISVGAAGGYDFGVTRLEGEISYKHMEMKSITDNADGFQFGNPDGRIGVLAFMFNIFFDLHNNTPVTPYFGGGVGVAELHLSDTTAIDTRGTVRPVFLYPSGDTSVFAYQGGAGLGIALNRLVTLDLGYRFFGTTTAKFDSNVVVTNELKIGSHNAIAGLRIKFY